MIGLDVSRCCFLRLRLVGRDGGAVRRGELARPADIGRRRGASEAVGESEQGGKTERGKPHELAVLAWAP